MLTFCLRYHLPPLVMLQEDRPCITDAEYDALRLRSQAIEARFPDLVGAESPSLRVGTAVPEAMPDGRVVDHPQSNATSAAAAAEARVRLPYVQHLRPLSSLDNVFVEQKVREFVERVCRAADVATLGEGGGGGSVVADGLGERNDGGNDTLVDPAAASSAVAAAPAAIVLEAEHAGNITAIHTTGGQIDGGAVVAGSKGRTMTAAREERDGATTITTVDQQVPAPGMEFVAEAKIDGLTCALLYEDGLLVRAATRGDGVRGEDVTPNALALGEGVLPHRLVPSADVGNGVGRITAAAAGAIPARLEVRGEIFMPDESFARLNAKREAQDLPPFASARNAAAGSLRQLDPKVSRGRGLRFFAYGAALGDGDVDGLGPGGARGGGGRRSAEEGGDVEKGLSLAGIFGTQVRSVKCCREWSGAVGPSVHRAIIFFISFVTCSFVVLASYQFCGLAVKMFNFSSSALFLLDITVHFL